MRPTNAMILIALGDFINISIPCNNGSSRTKASVTKKAKVFNTTNICVSWVTARFLQNWNIARRTPFITMFDCHDAVLPVFPSIVKI